MATGKVHGRETLLSYDDRVIIADRENPALFATEPDFAINQAMLELYALFNTVAGRLMNTMTNLSG